jgi:hypothetical protein
MTRLQKFFKTILPRQWADDMEAESRRWLMRCAACSHEQSVWDAGGIRWKAKGQPRRLLTCAQCHQTTWHTIYQKDSQ